MRVGRRLDLEGLAQITFAGLRRRRREGHKRDTRKKGAQLPELAVVGPEVVAPFRDAVRLIHHNSGQQVRSVQLLQDISKTFR